MNRTKSPKLQLAVAQTLEVHFKNRTERYLITFDKIKSELSHKQLINFFRAKYTTYEIEHSNGLLEVSSRQKGCS